MSEYEYKYWCGNCQIRIYIQKHYGRILTWQDCPYTCEYATVMRCSTEAIGMDEYIRKQDAINAADRADYTGLAVEDVKKVTDEVIKELKKLSSAERKGKWKTAYLDHISMGIRPKVLYCSECNQCIAYPTNFCPNCGAKNDI